MASNDNSERKGFTITWIIENFKYSKYRNGDRLESPTFVVDTMEKTKWFLYVFPRFFNIEDDLSLGLVRMLDCKGPRSIKIDCKCELLTADGWIAGEYNLIKQRVFKKDCVSFGSFPLKYGIPADELEYFLPNGTLTVRCKMWKCSEEIKNDGYCTARTRTGVEKKSSIWSVRNFSTLGIRNELTNRINSTLNDKPIVTLKFSMTGEDGTLQVSIIPYDIEVSSRTFSIKFSVLDINGEAVTCGESEPVFKYFLEGPECSLTLTKKEIMRNKSQYLRDDVLRLLYECNFSTGLVYEEIENTNYGWIPPQTANACLPDLKLAENTTPTTNQSGPTLMKRDIELMLNENVLCDVKLRTGAETFPAHWFILSARSPVFRAMFQSDMKEKAQDCIHIEDVDADTVRRLLLYMYTDACEDLQWESASQLYAAADKYQILSLKDECSSFLKANLDAANACEALMIADLHRDEHLKSATSEFILKHDKEIFKSDEWKRLIQTNGQLAFQTMLLKYED
ncbi:TD and POZ domain-containing protein 1 [Caerostris extrusa]|uniref:TD and POZ domain-containing protein 1 n=1 Tax=Caerostris extrusa TaxID=172846 RepID=A0AAV4S205_CAEEX|nr:TD and POZ domain-containing protein 1 [Caerostris extrusa]